MKFEFIQCAILAKIQILMLSFFHLFETVLYGRNETVDFCSAYSAEARSSKANFKATRRGHAAFILEAKPIFGISLTYAFIWYRSCLVQLRSSGDRTPD